ncbi:MAG: Proteasome subunit beta type-4 [Bathelium mastoideum]|nr:MAG: Proteasome subunit beta type-4 [Bathelium mastoideum]
MQNDIYPSREEAGGFNCERRFIQKPIATDGAHNEDQNPSSSLSRPVGNHCSPLPNTSPDRTPMFQSICNGDVEGLQDLIARCKATLRDADYEGTPLLVYAVLQPRMIKFLIEQGADVDEVSGSGRNPFTQEFAICSVGCLGSSVIHECWRLLLLAGADPMVERFRDPFAVRNGIATFASTKELLRMTFDFAGPLFDLSYRDANGHGLLHEAVGQASIGTVVPSYLTLLLERGADIDARDNFGRTCLHICIMECTEFSFPYPDGLAPLQALKILIKHDANVSAVDQYGKPPSSYAYCPNFCLDLANSSRRGDLWDAALAQCGYNVGEMRKNNPHPRRPREVLLGLTGRDFVLMAASKAAMRGATILKASDDKTRALTRHTLLAFSGEAGDTVQFAEYVQANVALYSMRNDSDLGPGAVASFTRSELARSLRSRSPYMVNLLLGGWDVLGGKDLEVEGESAEGEGKKEVGGGKVIKKMGCARLYWIDYLASQAEVPYAAHGYAQYYCLSILDKHHHPDIDFDQGMKILKMCSDELKRRLPIDFKGLIVKVMTKDGIRDVEFDDSAPVKSA